MLVKLYNENPNERELERIADILRNDGVVIYPTDTVYGMGCAYNSKKAIEKIVKIKGIREKDAQFSLICSDLSHLADFAKVDNPTFKVLKRNLPGAFTFILPASNKVPDKFLSRKKTVGLRIPDNNITLAIVKTLGVPLLNTSIKDDDDEIREYITDPELIDERFGDIVDVVIDGGAGDIIASTVVDCINDSFDIIRQGKGELLFN